MSASSEGVTSWKPDGKQNSAAPILRLLVAWGCSLIWELGSLVAIFAWFRYAFQGFPFGEAPPASLLLPLACGLGLILATPGPILMGLFLAQGRRGILAGGFAAIAGGITLLLGWLAWSVTDQSVFLAAIPAATVIGILILTSIEPFPNRGWGVAVGLATGLGLSIVTSLIFETIFTKESPSPLIQIPPLIWVSAVYFVDMFRVHTGRRSFAIAIGIVLLLATFGLPFLIDPILSRLLG